MEIRVEANGLPYSIHHVTTNLMTGRLDVRVRLHKHPVFHIIYILEGRASVTVGSHTTTALPGMLYVISPNEPHQFHFGVGENLVNLESTFQFHDPQGQAAEVNFFDMVELNHGISIPQAIRSHPFQVEQRFKPLLTEGFGRILDLYGGVMRPTCVSPGARCGAAWQLSDHKKNHFSIMVADLMARVETVISSVIREVVVRNQSEAMVETVQHFLFANRSRTVTLWETAQVAYVSPNYLCRIFKEHTGQTPMGYLQAVRMREAENLLALTDLPIYAIAEKLGYGEPSYFARVFGSKYGMSPQNYRKALFSGSKR